MLPTLAVALAFAARQPVPYKGAPLPMHTSRRSAPLMMADEPRENLTLAASTLNKLEDAWQRYVLLRPGMGMDELKETTRLRTAQEWSWGNRAPGTARTLIGSAALISLFAIPLLLTNPVVFAYLVEFASLSKAGVSPAEFFGSALRNLDLGSVAVGAAGELGRLGADTVESFLRLVGEQAL